MPSISVNGAGLQYIESGQGAETLVFSHGLLLNHAMFRAQYETLSAHYRCIAYDHRGQGGSEVTRQGYAMDELANDAAELITTLDAAPCHFIGLSMGGFVGQRLAAERPGLLRSLSLLATSADPEPAHTARSYRHMNRVARWLGLRPLVGRVMPILFGNTFMRDPQRAGERAYWKRQILAAHRMGMVRSARAIIEREGMMERLPSIRTPTLILVGTEDTATPPSRAERMAAAIPGARLARIEAAGHSLTIERPEPVLDELRRFLERCRDGPRPASGSPAP